jgi:hypothetical protein
MRCSNCGSENPAGKRFCGDCGTPLDRLPSEHPALGERRHLTVLFCDLVNSTNLASQLDPEEWREIIASYHRTTAQAISRFGGHVAQYLGDGVVAYFGWPEAHDNAAESAARAGLSIVEQITKLSLHNRGTSGSQREWASTPGQLWWEQDQAMKLTFSVMYRISLHAPRLQRNPMRWL